jgi:hypothetical protein
MNRQVDCGVNSSDTLPRALNCVLVTRPPFDPVFGLAQVTSQVFSCQALDDPLVPDLDGGSRIIIVSQWKVQFVM